MFGDSAYGTGEFQQHLDDLGIGSYCRTQPPAPPKGGLFSKDHFTVDLNRGTVTCPNKVTVTIRRGIHGNAIAYFAENCTGCPLKARCTPSKGGRTIRVHIFEAELTRAWNRQHDADYRHHERKQHDRDQLLRCFDEGGMLVVLGHAEFPVVCTGKMLILA